VFHRWTAHLELCRGDTGSKSERRTGRAREGRATAVSSASEALVMRDIDDFRVMLDAFARRHEGQKIYLRQQAAQRWISWRDQVLQGQRPHSGHTSQLAACDAQLRVVSVLSLLFMFLICGILIPYNRNLQPSQMILSTLICDLLTIKWGAGHMRTQAYDTFRDGFAPGVESK